jgi:hypothetical protein
MFSHARMLLKAAHARASFASTVREITELASRTRARLA